MIRHPRYPAYKDSGVEWLGEIPIHWGINIIKRYFEVELGKMLNRSKEDGSGIRKPYLRAANIHWHGIDLEAGINKMEFSPSELDRYRLLPGDLLVTEGGVTVGRSTIWNGELEECYYQNSLNRVRSINPKTVSMRYLYYWMYFTKLNGYIDLLADKATFQHLTNEMLKELPMLYPPLSEQRAIAAFLDRQTARIDAAIAEYHRLTDLLQEKRAALISHVVTQGLDPDVPLRDSGIAWLGEIPSHWGINIIKRYFEVELGKMLNRSKEDGSGIRKPYLRAANIHWHGIDLEAGINKMEFSPSELDRYRLLPGDLLVTEGGVTVGRSTIWNGELEECYYQNSLNRVRSINPNTVSMRYLYYWMYFTKLNGYIDLLADKATFQHLTNEMLKEFPMLYPPLSEQRAIAAYLDRQTARIAAAVTEIQTAIAHLEAYRTALISAAVTGKIDVRQTCNF